MADIYGSHFKFAGRSSREYGLIIVNINTDRFIKLGGDTKLNTIFNKKENRKYCVNTDYSDATMSIELEIVTENERVLEKRERREIEKWLFRQNEYCKMYLDIADDFTADTYEYVDGEIKRNYFNCKLINPEKIECSAGVIGFKFTMETDSDLMWQDSIVNEFNTGIPDQESSKIISVLVDTDSTEYTYPKITLCLGEVGGNIIISNDSDDSTRITKFVDLLPNSIITMDGNVNVVGEEYYNHFATKNFIRLLDGENKLMIMGNVKSMTVEFANRRSL